MRAATTGLAVLLASCLLSGACGSLPDDTSTGPEPVAARPSPTPTEPNPNPSPVMGAPAPDATPTPEPGSQPSPEPTPTPTSTGGCGNPVPPGIGRVGVKVHLKGSDFWTLDSTPQVGPNPEYCAKIGYTDGRSYCPVRTETDPERGACEAYAVGNAKDTGRPGPTWYRDGSFCTGGASGCDNHAENQYLLKAFASGTYRACVKNGVCGEEVVER